MKPLKHLLFFLIVLFLFSYCQEETIPKPLPEIGYPYSYPQLSEAEFNVRNAEFQSVNIYEGLTLNSFGFMQGEIPLNETDSITEDFVLKKVSDIIDRYSRFLGIPKNTTIDLKTKIQIFIPPYLPRYRTNVEGYFENLDEFKKEPYWEEIAEYFQIHHFFIEQKNIGGYSFEGPRLYFNFDEQKKSVQILKNWYPGLFAPEKEIYTEEEAIGISCRQILSNYGKDLWEIKHTFRIERIYIVHHDGTNITIHECWKITANIKEEYYNFYVYIDTQTGEVIQLTKIGTMMY